MAAGEASAAGDGAAVRGRNGGRDGGGAATAQHVAHAANLLFHLFGGAIALAQQNRGGTQIVVSVHKVFDSGSHGAIHHL
jgi:hypothetical protein